MVAPAIGEVVLVPFPFSDLSQSKVRPAICLADVGRGDWILCQITSNAYGDPYAVPVLDPDFVAGGLRVASFVRPGKLFTAHRSLLIRSVGQLGPTKLQPILSAVAAFFQPVNRS